MPSKLRFHSRMAATNSAAIEWFGREDSERYSSSSDWPDQNVCSKRSMERLVRLNSTILSMAIAQTQTEHTSSPSITALTTQWACQNSVNSERSEDVSGSTDCATSAGFISTSFSLSGQTGAAHVVDSSSAAGISLTRTTESLAKISSVQSPVGPDEIPAKLGQTRALKRV